MSRFINMCTLYALLIFIIKGFKFDNGKTSECSNATNQPLGIDNSLCTEQLINNVTNNNRVKYLL